MKVTLNLGDLDVKAKGMTFEIKDGSKKFDTLAVSSSGITLNNKKITWKKLGEILDDDKPAKKSVTSKTTTKKASSKKIVTKKVVAKKPKAKKTTTIKKVARSKDSKSKL
ncbi:hypothetical protein Psal006b_03348 (plasmid) [Piscirickettsia salmonis]|uniref:Uncharacterized protein n=1 Tax=Piscirickettsia salmonis TaxID=1238 RepID=A0A1L6THY4_PISSA|nr:hypothetical protein [Piscirickettsia salmonis]AKP74883.1 hypothetical protein PSLF89_1p44 [Piscirickettsia salmonis LF-89 = ATCC VR-1361]ALB24506.1 hypothetical protein KU39_3p44 [Piscirickettsia salmonis]ALY04411.1 hypothetical protein AWE47_15910 [Piscirickettsia salmonis]AOS37074.1 hypothetical protein AVM72_17115 [Piscirickettsia salmonis]APS62199.1 hypothetical protein AVI53_16750 [Piscirickettsia salmonis]